MEGPFANIQHKLEANPKTKIPQILFTVYQHVFNSIYILASILNTPYPPPDLLHPMAEKIRILPRSEAEQTRATEQPSTPEKAPPTLTVNKDVAPTQQPPSVQPVASGPAGQTSARATSGQTQTNTAQP